MKKIIYSSLLLLGVSAPSHSSLLITGVLDGTQPGGNPKAIELYATETIVDLSVFGLGSANNGGGSDGEELTLGGSISAGSYLYITNDQTNFNQVFGQNADFVSSVALINGDDAIELFQNGSVIDVFGDINVDGTGTGWEYMDSWAYRMNGTGPDGMNFMLANWSFGGMNALDGLDTSQINNAVPFGTFTPVPLPGAIWLFGAGALAVYRYKQTRQQS